MPVFVLHKNWIPPQAPPVFTSVTFAQVVSPEAYRSSASHERNGLSSPSRRAASASERRRRVASLIIEDLDVLLCIAERADIAIAYVTSDNHVLTFNETKGDHIFKTLLDSYLSQDNVQRGTLVTNHISCKCIQSDNLNAVFDEHTRSFLNKLRSNDVNATLILSISQQETHCYTIGDDF